ncbi:hypothetical protein LRS13_12655 [Svornostia abyssi]|uniref:Uncharacterized protein n=1 Tax=Svornostia abyssi TaxID=2898438 RepID=A0ABY5PAR2_9ACTN|nr:hypothetical protein LRS13_12655 [Parviterribacteraceae bacterium J379]
MNPPSYVRLQALATLLLSVTALALLGSGVAFVLLLILVGAQAVWIWMGTWYLLSRRRWERRDPSAHARSAQRADLDRVMARNDVIGILLPALAALGVTALGPSNQLYVPPVAGTMEVIIAICGISVPLSMLVSSSVDWYLIRSFREGVIGAPACQPHVAGSDASVSHLKYWVMNRLVCEFIVWIAVAIGIGYLSSLVENATSDPTSKATFNLLGFIGIAAWSIRELAKLPTAVEFVRFPSVGIGQHVTGRNPDCDMISGYVHDVALVPGVQLIEAPVGNPAKDFSLPKRSVPLRQRDTLEDATATAPHPHRCASHCEFWIPACEVGLRSPAGAAPAPAD